MDRIPITYIYNIKKSKDYEKEYHRCIRGRSGRNACVRKLPRELWRVYNPHHREPAMKILLFISYIISGNVESAKMWGLAIGLMALMVLASSLMDLYFGIKASKACGIYKTTSYGLRATAEKDVTYLMLFFLAAFIDACLSLWISIPVACVLVAIGEIAIEAVSVWENRKRVKDGRADPLNVAKAMAKSLGIKDAHKIEILYDTIKEEIEKAKEAEHGKD